ncbi:MAG: hypothetical protein JW958_13515 [Candidatus Eisenbacteria bacterium]|nr:hypothetical protein [Candidatus Eisenbacteria bacterium]
MLKILSALAFSHWSTLVENFQASSQEFYASLEEALKRRQIPHISTSRVVYPETGAFSPKREYLRVKREDLLFDICAAPFGTGFFFSWWLTMKERRWGLLWGIVFFSVLSVLTRLLFPVLAPLVANVIGSPLMLMGATDHSVLYLLVAILVFFGMLWVSALLARVGFTLFEEAILSIPLLNLFYAWIFRPLTYYRVDTMLMFEKMVQTAVLEVIDSMTSAKGIRALSEDERKPIHRGLLKR